MVNMASRGLKRMGLSQDTLEKLEAKKFTTVQMDGSSISVQHLFNASEIELVETLGLSPLQLCSVFEKICKHVCPKPQTALDMLQNCSAIRNSLLIFPNQHASRVPAGTLTELVGPAGVGKTQCCLTLAIQATLPVQNGGLGGSVLYLDTESSFSPSRLMEIAQMRYPDLFKDSDALNRLLSAVIVHQPQSIAQLKQRALGLQSEIIERDVKLIILDSIAAPVRSQFDKDHLLDRQQLLGELSSTLKHLSETFAIPVVVTNQVTTKLVQGPAELDPAQSRETFLAAALGVAWAHAVNIRFVLESADDHSVFTVAKSPLVPMCKYEYRITDGGLEVTAVDEAAEYANHNVLEMKMTKRR